MFAKKKNDDDTMSAREDQPRLRRCEACKRYTLINVCPDCGARAVEPHPPKYSPEDKYAEYRRKANRPELEKEGVK